MTVRGVDEFRRDLRRVDRRIGRGFQKANKRIAERVVAKGRPAVKRLPSPGGTIAKAGIRPRGSQRSAKVAFLGSNPTVRANVLGTKSHWVFGRRVAGSGPWLPHVGNRWKPSELHGIGPVIKRTADTVTMDQYVDAVMDGLAEAFPEVI